MPSRHTFLRVALATFIGFMAVTIAGAQAAKFKVLHTFTGGSDGVGPNGPLALDTAGNLYGVTVLGGSGTQCSGGCGIVFELLPSGTKWKERILYNFSGFASSYVDPAGSLVFDKKGNVYGTTGQGGDPTCRCGEVYELTRATNWTQTVLHTFLGGSSDGAYPSFGVIEDRAGNLYGVTQTGGLNSGNYGTVFGLTPNSDGTWTENIIYEFTGSRDGSDPYGNLALDTAGNLYGATSGGGVYGLGTVFKLTPTNGAWTETTLYAFTGGENGYSSGGIVLDSAGNLYGTTTSGGSDAVGNVFKLTPANGYWNFSTVHSFTGGRDGGYPEGRLTLDQAGNIYGTTALGGTYQYGTVFRLTLAQGVWKETVLHNFANGADGQGPYGGLTLDSSGNLYGVASGGINNQGLVFEITP
jgi:uncharacterized repeat protein (TIGR03803 family)